jgi:hypothetical protein
MKSYHANSGAGIAGLTLKEHESRAYCFSYGNLQEALGVKRTISMIQASH